ncbi:hypothetical protein CCAX7_009450 [Capsulimonas corticalis]|uniref:Uncharacterized protein n=1 Tax=Capsulimonas corticalis TaxID=2219043 RepID=A0A402CUA3_9BACT|nr:hypothetical protein [Capsulimonas corticalis]BDI28894.1 hypothetical protein CCAX7_009450 [Capsulimonas corticalis]
MSKLHSTSEPFADNLAADIDRGNTPAPAKNRLLPLGLAVVAGVVAFGVASVLPKQYRTESTLYFPSAGDSGAGSIISALNGFGGGGVGDKGGSVGLLGGMISSPQVASGPNTSIAILTSVRCQTQVAQICHLQEHYHTTRMPIVLKMLTAASTFAVNKNGLLQVEIADQDPHVAAAINQAYLDTLKSIATDLSVDVSRRNRIFIEERLKTQRAKLTAQESLYSEMQKSPTQALTGTAGSDKLVSAYVELQTQANQAAIDLSAVDARIRWQTGVAKAASGPSLDAASVIPKVQPSVERLRGLESRFSIAQATLGPDNPDYRYLQIQVELARREVRSEVERELNQTQSGIAPEVSTLYATRAALQAQHDGLNRSLTQLKDKVVAIPVTKMREAHMTAEVETGEKLVAMLETEAERARLAEARDSTTFEVIDPPTPPDEPFAPRRAFIAGIAALAGFLLGLAWLAAKSLGKDGLMGMDAKHDSL